MLALDEDDVNKRVKKFMKPEAVKSMEKENFGVNWGKSKREAREKGAGHYHLCYHIFFIIHHSSSSSSS
jgi:hypothetical protein